MDVTSCFDLFYGIKDILAGLQTWQAQFYGLAGLLTALYQTIVTFKEGL